MGFRAFGINISMKSLQEFITESISPSDLESWRADSLMWSKNILRIKTPEELYHVSKEYQAWQKNFEHFVYDKLLERKKKHDTWWRKEAAEKCWHYHMYYEVFRADGIGSYNFETGKHYDANDPVWIKKVFDAWLPKRKSKHVKYLKLAKIAFDALDTFFRNESKDGVMPDRAVEWDTNIDGIQVRFELDETDKFVAQDRDRIISNLKDAFGILKRAGMSRILRGLKVVIEDRFNHDEAGRYESFTTSIHLTLWGIGTRAELVKVVAHECGHRWDHEILSRQAYEEWRKLYAEPDFPHVTEYSKKNSGEGFAETFAWYALGLPMSASLRAKFKTICGFN